jgi:FtsZ-binding cell division protein ZapB
MNVVGKILVILNLLVALVVAFFIVIVNRTSTNWKVYAESREREIKSLTIARDTHQETASQLQIEIKNLKDERDKLKKAAGTATVSQQDVVERLRAENEVLKQERAAAAADAKSAEAAQQNFIKIAADRLETIEKREGLILKLNEEYRDLKRREQELKEHGDRLQLRAESLQEEYRKSQKKIEELLAQGANGNGNMASAPTPKKANDPNPPAKQVRGKIEKVHPDDKGLVQVDVGLDQGVDKNHTLEVYRLNPGPEYIGMIRIVDADFHSARARLIRSQFAPAKTIREGDQVVSSLDLVK